MERAPTEFIFSRLRLSVVACSLFISLPAMAATVDIEQKPLLVNDPLPPNIMFILDDSGSMFQDDMPGSINCSDAYSNNSRIIHYDRSNDSNSTGNLLTDKLRCESPDYNKIYYNPNVTYEAPVDADGNSLGDSEFYSAWTNGYERRATKNLAEWVSERREEERTVYRWDRQRRGWYCEVAPTDNICPDGRRKYDDDRDRNYRYWEMQETVYITEWKPFRYAVFDSSNSGCYGSETDDDCYDEVYVDVNDTDELRNVANWYSYYRTRILLAKTSVSLAFNNLNTDYRLGWGSLNRSGGTIASRVLDYSRTRADFYKWIDGIWSGYNYGTGLRKSLDDAGQYFSSAHPYLIDPSDSGSGYLSCRQNFTILMTDGYWSEGSSYQASTSAARADNDGNNGPTITGPGGRSYTYSAVSPFKLSDSNNLADVAMYYWKNDLRPGTSDDNKNDVPATTQDPAFWQHMVTIGIGLGVEGQINKDDAFNAIDSSATINWPDPDNSDNAKIDDLLHASVNSRGNYFSAQNPTEFIAGLEASLAEISTRIGSGSALAASSSQLQAGTTLFNASYRSGDWSGSLAAWALDPTTGELTNRRWEASVPGHTGRSIYTAKTAPNGSITSVLFSQESDLDADMRSALVNAFPGGTASAQDLIDYLRGDQSREVSASGPFRNRASGVLGDIVHTTPVLVGAPDASRYKYTDWPEADSYASFASTHSSRSDMVYVSANDGMLHGFLADNASSNKGLEMFAYMPRAAIMNGLANLADPDYQHRYFVDGPLVAQDVYLKNQWRTVIIGTTGRAGNIGNDQTGKAIFALDVTDPSNLGSSSLLWEISHDDVGQITSPPVIARLDDGEWYAIFGNGYNSANDRAALIRVKLEDGTVTVIPGTSSASPNGLAGPLVWDLNGDGSADTAYAGDLEGNVYKFDLINTAITPQIIYVAKDASGRRQPITAGMTGTEDDNGDTWIHFGTGKYLSIADMSNRDTQSWYGLKAEDITSLNTRADLKERTISSGSSLGDFTARTVSEAVSGDMANKKGWFIDFNASDAPGERIVLPSQIRGDVLIGYTVIPIADACNPGGDGFVMAVNPFTGGRLDRIYFDFNGDGEFNSADQLSGESPSGFSVGRIPSTGVFVDDDLHFNTDSAVSEVVATNPGTGSGDTDRISWREISE